MALAPVLAAPFLLAAGASAPDACPDGGPDSVVICTIEDVEDPYSCPDDGTGSCPVEPEQPPSDGPDEDNEQSTDNGADENEADNGADENEADNGADENKADNGADENKADPNRDVCKECRAPPGWPFYALTDWLVPLLALLALLLAILALLLAAARRRGESGRDGDRHRPPMIPIIPPGDGDGGGGGYERHRGVVVLPLPPGGGGGGEDRDRGSGAFAFTAGDRRLLEFLDARNEEMRRVLTTLARMGVAWRLAEPARAQAWLERLEPHPFYKAGQVMFDLLEWEDFMLDGKSAVADTNEIGQFVSKVAGFLGLPPPSPVVAGDLPPLQPGFYLYRDVVLGGLAAGVATFPSRAEPER